MEPAGDVVSGFFGRKSSRRADEEDGEEEDEEEDGEEAAEDDMGRPREQEALLYLTTFAALTLEVFQDFTVNMPRRQ